MPEFFIVLLKINVALILCSLAYYFVLRRLTFYTLNRAFLLTGILFSSLYPFVDVSSFFQHQRIALPVIAQMPVILEEVALGFDYWVFAKAVFWGGVVLMAGRTLVRLYSLYRVHQNSTPGTVRQHQVRILQGEVSTFSFWKNIYINPELHTPDELDSVLAHEYIHVKQLHTVDILLAELTTIFYWFNPGVWYIRKAVKENVEFITDQKILQSGRDRKAYQYSMLSSSNFGQPSALMNNFNITGIKRRIIMMNRRRSSQFQLVRYVVLLPVVFLLTTAFTVFRKEVKVALSHPALVSKQDQDTLSFVKPNVVVVTKPITKTLSKAQKQIRILPTVKSEELSDTLPKPLVEKPIVVKGFAFHRDDTDSLPKKRKVIFVQRNVSEDGSKKDFDFDNAKIFIDDVEASDLQLRALASPGNIKNMNIIKGKDGERSQIRIYTQIIKN